jgi:hypothetical protein
VVYLKCVITFLGEAPKLEVTIRIGEQVGLHNRKESSWRSLVQKNPRNAGSEMNSVCVCVRACVRVCV